MNDLESLSLQGHINAVEFFGIDMRNVKTLELDMLDELCQLSQPGMRGQGLRRFASVLYKGRQIEVQSDRLTAWVNYAKSMME